MKSTFVTSSTVNYLCDWHLRKHKSRGGGGGPGLTHHHGGTPWVQVQLQQVPAAQVLKCWFDSHRIQRFIEALYSDIKLQIGLFISCAKRLVFFICYGNPLQLLIKLHKLNPLEKYLKVGKFLICLWLVNSLFVYLRTFPTRVHLLQKAGRNRDACTTLWRHTPEVS
jgi:hypothetical protein